MMKDGYAISNFDFIYVDLLENLLKLSKYVEELPFILNIEYWHQRHKVQEQMYPNEIVLPFKPECPKKASSDPLQGSHVIKLS